MKYYQQFLFLLASICIACAFPDKYVSQQKKNQESNNNPAKDEQFENQDSESDDHKDNTPPDADTDPVIIVNYDNVFVDCVHYKDFGAVGDGQTNDINALVLAHNFANENNKCVQADAGATYYINEVAQSAIIKTPTDWRGATFKIDDSNITTANNTHIQHIFTVAASVPTYWVKIGGINQGAQTDITSLTRHQKNLGLTLPQESIVVVFNTLKNIYIRDGKNEDPGVAQMDFLLVDTQGNIADTSPIMYDYDIVTDIQVFPIDQDELPIVGGTFITIANQENSTEYYNRGIRIERSNVVIDGFLHHIEGEGSHGAPYNGIITMTYAANITIRNSTFTAHKTYIDMNKLTQMGSYDIQPTGIINLTLDHCTQTTDILDSAYWGLIGSNYCKNIILKSCKFSRFDAHKGVAGVTIRNSQIGHQGILITGEGDLNIKNTTAYGASFITMRTDYGSTWRGNLNIENCTWHPYGTGVTYAPYVLYGEYSGKHDFGYECYMPQTINIRGLKIINSIPVYLLANITPENTGSDFAYQYPYHITETINISGYEDKNGQKWKLCPTGTFMFNNVTVNELD